MTINDDAQEINENHEAAVKGGTAVGNARRNFEKTRIQAFSASIFLELENKPKEELPSVGA